MSIKVINQVLQTTDYNLFKKLDGNRRLNKAHVKRLLDSFRKEKLQCPIVVNQNYEIIDGQHRFESSKELGLPVDFIMCNDYGLREVQLLNSNSSNWKKEDYLNAFCDSGEKEYLKFREFMNEFPEFGISSCESLLTGLARGDKQVMCKDSNGNSMRMGIRAFENGELFIPDYEKSRDYAKKILAVKPFYDGFNRRPFVVAMIQVINNPNYSHERFIKKLSTRPQSLFNCSDAPKYKQLIEDIYNTRVNAKDKVTLRF